MLNRVMRPHRPKTQRNGYGTFTHRVGEAPCCTARLSSCCQATRHRKESNQTKHKSVGTVDVTRRSFINRTTGNTAPLWVHVRGLFNHYLAHANTWIAFEGKNNTHLCTAYTTRYTKHNKIYHSLSTQRRRCGRRHRLRWGQILPAPRRIGWGQPASILEPASNSLPSTPCGREQTHRNLQGPVGRSVGDGTI